MTNPADPHTAAVLAANSAFADTIMQPPRLLGLEAGDVLAQKLGPRRIIIITEPMTTWRAVDGS